MTHGLNRFVAAQDRGSTYELALAELRSGQKRSHWMWFVFPQVSGLGRSDTARFYALSGLDEAREYLGHPVLGRRLIECVEALVSLPGSDPMAVMGGTDAQKFRSSMTPFLHAAGESERARFKAVLDKYFRGTEDEATVRACYDVSASCSDTPPTVGGRPWERCSDGGQRPAFMVKRRLCRTQFLSRSPE